MVFGISCTRPHLIRDPVRRREVETDFRKVREMAHAREKELFGVFEKDLVPPEKEGLMFLYAYMPLSDLADYEGQYFLRQVRTALKARREMPWGNKVPEGIFLHFVLPSRVNNENLDTFRQVFYEELKQRVKGMGMEEAALEINHWCHEKVWYAPADIRTSSPLNTVKNARGRCGEESTFTVAALRTVGIPARQVYVPRWAHTDDNHAWVEVWIDGKWHYMGACEPDPYLDMGWFTEPASRSMMIHTYAYGRYHGDEPLIRNAGRFAEINCLARYAPTRKAVVKVTDVRGVPLAGVRVYYRLYNYAEFFPLAVLTTAGDGTTTLETGRGGLLIEAVAGGKYALAHMAVDRQDTLTIIPEHLPEDTFSLDVDLVPPPVQRHNPTVPLPLKHRNDLRLAREDSIRLAYVATFFDSIRAREWALVHRFPPERTVPLLVKSHGNHPVLTRFLAQVPDTLREKALLLLEHLSDKDLRDVTLPVLQDHLVHAPPVPEKDKERYAAYILSPRVANELLTPYRSFFFQKVSDTLRHQWSKEPESLGKWLEEKIVMDEKENYYHVPLTPPGSWSLGITDLHSLKILCVSLFRTVGVAARLEPVRDVVQYRLGGTWHDLFLDDEEPLPGQTACLTLSGEKEWSYYTTFTLARYRQGTFRTLEYPYALPLSHFSDLPVDPGNYLLVSGYRTQDGKVLAHLRTFLLRDKEEKVITVLRREEPLISLAYTSMPAGGLYDMHGAFHGLNELFHPSGTLLCWLDTRYEPSRHLLQELTALFRALSGWKGRWILVPLTGEGEDLERAGGDPSILRRMEIMYDPGNKWLRQVYRQLAPKKKTPEPPVIILLDERGEVKDFIVGYHIGLAERVSRAVRMISQTKHTMP